DAAYHSEVRITVPVPRQPGDYDVPAEVYGSCDAAEFPRPRHAVAAPPVDQDCTGRAPDDGSEDEGPVPKSQRRQRKCGARAQQCLDSVRPGDPAEVEI